MLIDPIRYPFKYVHNHEDGCGKVAFYFDGHLKHGAVINAQDAIFPDGTYPGPTDAFKCGTCGKEFKDIIIEHVEATCAK